MEALPVFTKKEWLVMKKFDPELPQPLMSRAFSVKFFV